MDKIALQLPNGNTIYYLESGEGIPFIFLHGLGGSLEQPASIYGNDESGIRFLSYDQKLHGENLKNTSNYEFSLDTLVEDLLGFLEKMQITQAIIGGISLGAAVSMKFALVYPERVLALCIIRPAIGSQKDAENLHVYKEIVKYLKQDGTDKGLIQFTLTKTYRDLASAEHANALSCIKQFFVDDYSAACIRLSAITQMSAFDSLNTLSQLHIPVFIAATQNDRIHPFLLADQISHSIPNSTFIEIISKSKDAQRHHKELQISLHRFLEIQVQKCFGNTKK